MSAAKPPQPAAMDNNEIEKTLAKVENLPTTRSSSTLSLFDLKSNPYFGAGFGLVLVGTGLTILKRATSLGYTLAQKHLTVSLEVVSRDKSYDWLLNWINAHLSERAQHVSVQTFFARNDKSHRVSTSFSFAPSIGTHYFKYANSWIRAERAREQAVDRNTGSPVETLKLTTLGRDTQLFTRMLLKARTQALDEQVGKTLIYNASLGKSLFYSSDSSILSIQSGAEWTLYGYPKDKRPFSSVVLDQGIAVGIKKDISDFLTCSKWYNARGIPYRRG